MIPLLPMRLTFAPATPLRLPPYPGALWRGALGKALRELACITGAQACADCPVIRRCGYGLLFETRGHAQAGGLAGHYAELPHPYVVSPRTDAGDTSVTLELTLIGAAARRHREVLDAAAKLRLNGVPLTLREARPLAINAAAKTSFAAEIPQPPAAPPRVRMILEHPLRLRRENRYLTAAEFDFATLFTALTRRVSMLHDLEAAAPLRADYRGLAAAARAVRVNAVHLEWFDWARYSARQRRRIPMGGLIGELALSGEFAPLWPWLWLGQWLHVGKGAVMGLGRYRLEARP
ncbi:CRISPR system precrRNA processing endoribonuclease RAMP protein Cas6 [Nitrococcus mobilis]|uniref:CRISPR-associated protein Cas6 C-terminal domain-containing protein n=1 Tax=Nitrococcus mobilis Nb-231 TaxID=314278 RepID=A4BL60_9GAMM|nr:CRISPR system precrRNA processing endoribonuclease RAMP protein Cas6 [Nitrococcus mobilis]EAR23048.1 possible A. fulgidus predicted coding region AF1859 [Nitrococcus mobilis Nb-231]